jgi:hypothetical protein
LRPLLGKVGIKLSPELVFNLLLLLLAVIVYRSIAGRISRARARRSYAAGARKAA